MCGKHELNLPSYNGEIKCFHCNFVNKKGKSN